VARSIESSDNTGFLFARDVSYAHLPHSAQNTELAYSLSCLHVRIDKIHRVLLYVESQSKPTIDTLQRIVSAVLAGDPIGARNSCMEHVKSSAAATLKAMARTP